MSNRIVLLDDQTASRIAAGEVVERPASAVKELVENAIDAGATRIEVHLIEGGKKRIEVADNGIGMSAEDSVLAVQRHATSKIRTSDDLFSITTLGFRGEALPSIASVSHFTLTTKSSESAAGTRLVIHGGSLDEVTEVGCRVGTVVQVDDLFYNTPARLKFLKTTPTELTRCVEIVSALAPAYPGIAFRVMHGNSDALVTPGTGELIAALAAVWGREMCRNMAPIKLDEVNLTVRGYVGPPDIARAGRSHQLFIVNGRPVRNRSLTHALEHAFRGITPESRYPVACIVIDQDPSMVDVNVHPTKLEVKFTREGDIHAAVVDAVSRALREHGHVTSVASRPLSPHPVPVSPANWSRPSADAVSRAVAAFAPDTLLPNTEPAEMEPGLTAQEGQPSLADQLRGFRVLGQLHNTYIVAATDAGAVFVDQHVAHERILYERLTATRHERGVPVQRLAIPLTLTFGAAEAALLSSRHEDFRALGWEIEPFGRDAIVVRAAPALIKPGNLEAILRDMVDELVHQTVARRLVVDRDQVTIANACRMAVKAGDRLSIEEMEALLEQLANTHNPHFCPHGRPAVVAVTLAELERRFKR
jgi:DNA mismatch repair protein MutL